jgi:hypothetical protein
MESIGGGGDAGFFFAKAYTGFTTLFEALQHRCPNVFGNNGAEQQQTPFTSCYALIQRKLDTQFDNLIWLSDGKASEKEIYEKLSIIEYMILLDKKIADAMKQNRVRTSQRV